MASLAVELARARLEQKLPPGSIGNEIAEQKAASLANSEKLKADLARRDTGFGPKRTHPIIVKSSSKPQGGRTRRRFKKKRLMSHKYCKKTPCRHMGFTQKASCRPYKNCYTRRR